MPDATLVTAAKPAVSGALYRAPLGTTLPTDATTALGSAFVELGYTTDEGVTHAYSIDSDNIKAWGGDTVLTMQTGVTDEFSFTFLQTMDVNVLKAVWGDSNVSGSLAAGIAVGVGASEQEEACWVIDMILRGTNAKRRIVIPDGRITAIDDITYSDSDAVGYGVTITCMPDNTGKSHYEYTVRAAAST